MGILSRTSIIFAEIQRRRAIRPQPTSLLIVNSFRAMAVDRVQSARCPVLGLQSIQRIHRTQISERP